MSRVGASTKQRNRKLQQRARTQRARRLAADRREVAVGDPRRHAKLVDLHGTEQPDGSFLLANGIRVKP